MVLGGMFWFIVQVVRSGFSQLEEVVDADEAQIIGGELEEETGSIGHLWPESRIQFIGDEIRIGRDPENQVVLRDRFASGFHARILRRNHRYYIEDAGSTNHTFVNGERVRSLRALADGDVIKVGGDYPTVFLPGVSVARD